MSSISHAILALLADGEFHSGQEIGQTLSVTRSAVWKAIETHILPLDLPIERIRSKGYRVKGGIEFLTEKKLKNQLSEFNQLHCPEIVLLDNVDSTNEYLLKHAKTQPSKPQLCLTERQTQGRGRRGRTWHTGFARNIALSCLWYFPQGTQQLTGLSLVVGVAVANALMRFGVKGIGLKWPNDVIWQYRKLAGIAVEMSIDNLGACYAVIGIGLNVDLFNTHAVLPTWVALNEVMQRSCSRNEVAGLLIDELLLHLRAFEKTGLSAFIKPWERYNLLQEQLIDVHTLDTITTGIMQGIDNQGGLLVKTDDGVKSFHLGEIRVRAKHWPA